MKHDIVVTVEKITGYCPVFKSGDRFKIREGYIVEPSLPLCIHALLPVFHFVPALARGIGGREFGSKEDDFIFVSCPDPGPPFSCGGNVIFKLQREI